MPSYKNEGFYTMASQKISEKINNLPAIPSLSERWIWELIQNAKDSDNEFGKIKIKILILDDKFIFSHNGDPFTHKNVESLKFHFSAKDEENKKNGETTGKYGTGFMVTYAISKKVILQCKFKGPQQFSDEQENNDEDYEEQFDKIFDQKHQKETQKMMESEMNKQQKKLITNKQKIKEKKMAEKAKVEEPYYQDLKILLDRNHADTKQLKEKIRKLDKYVQKLLINVRKDKSCKRTEKSFDTCFIDPSFEMAVKFFKEPKENRKCPDKYTEQILERIYQMRFENSSIVDKILQHFNSQQQKEKQKVLCTSDLISLGQYLNSFQDIKLPQLYYAPLFSRFQATRIHLSITKIKTSDQRVAKVNNQLSNIFKKAFLKDILQMYADSTSINAFTRFLCDKDKIKAFEIINFLHKSQLIKLNSLPNADEEITFKNHISSSIHQLKWLKQGYNHLTDDDITIFDKLYNKCNFVFMSTQLKPIKKMLVHPNIIPVQSPHFFYYGGLSPTIQFSQLFKPVNTLYNQNTIKLQDKEAILNYTYNIYEEFIIKNNKKYEIKYNLFKEIINSRHLEFGKLLDKLNDEDKDLICMIFKMKDKFQDLRELIKNYNIEEILAVMRKRSRQK